MKHEHKDYTDQQEVSAKKEVFSWFKIILFAFFVTLVISYFIKPTLVSGRSMYPTLENNDYLILNKVAYQTGDPSRGDIVVFNSHLVGEKILIKRVIATGGEKITVKDGKVYINDKLINEPYLKGVETFGDVDTIVPKNKVFVMGDNRGNSIDSRRSEVGFVDKSEILGKVWFRVFPMKGIH
ncbi:signal peptidase I [Paenibacillus polymyxa]|uniref:Signal peptidase I n=1 Tax=Paenibacillus polymyxa (strain SC2) TaxID=886882 RepID=E3EKB9_PAEPS|nr:signal peptidase I [Paenibacillus polymyxa]ADO59446.1 signal peptidase [Paenibacillus polymyxa SC2]WPQ59714.1 signal peptidase I [Paenibacillus polymyxa]